MARPSKYNDELAKSICLRIADGESLKKITDEPDMPSRPTVHKWLIDKPEFLNNYEASKALQADVFADEMDEIAHSEQYDVQRARLIIDTRKWVASKLKPKKYGDKLDMTSDGKALPTPILRIDGVPRDNGNNQD